MHFGFSFDDGATITVAKVSLYTGFDTGVFDRGEVLVSDIILEQDIGNCILW